MDLIDRDNILVLLQASRKSLADCEGECEVDTGRRLGADLVVSGELLRFGSKLKLSMRLHETGVTAAPRSPSPDRARSADRAAAA